MYPHEVYLTVYTEYQQKNLEQKLKEQARDLALAPARPQNKMGRKLAGRLGAMLVRWGSKLQNFDTTAPSYVTNTQLSR